MKFKQTLLYFSLFAFHFSLLSAQEHLLPLKTNPVLVKYTKEAKKNHTPVWWILSDSIKATLPFLDDFSRPGPYPFDSLWMDNAAFINTTYPICPHTLGVATLDGVNSEGKPYNPNCPPGASYPADSLTSRPIDLSGYPVSDSLWISFYYQAGGRAPSPPLPADTLLLQFRTSQIPWTTIWYLNGYFPEATDTNFHLVMVPLKNLKFFDPSFQFRFKNYACTSANIDQWNIDEVYLDKHRSYSDTSQNDVSFVYECPTMLANYQYMPWNQFTDNDLRISMYLQERNNSNGPIAITDSCFINTMPAAKYPGGYANINPFFCCGYNSNSTQTNIPVKSIFSYNPLTGPTNITMTNILYSSNDFIAWNDTLRFNQIFSDYYAYDDGTSEAAYFINGTSPLYLAYQFTLNNPDTLQGLDLYFDYTFVNPSNYNMRLAIWNNDGTGGGPGTLLFEDDSIVSPIIGNTLDGFTFYPYHSPNPLGFTAGKTFYVGWIQTEGDSLDIGYDLNTFHNDKIYYYDGAYPPGDWQQGSIPGSMMMRPVFGSSKVLATPNVKNPYAYLAIYPNPAGNLVNLSSTIPYNTSLKIYTPEGKEYLSDNNFYGNSINTASLPAGFYIMEIIIKGEKPMYQKLIIER